MSGREISRKHAAWLRRETAAWVADGVVPPEAAATIVARYPVGARASAVRLVSTLGAAFIGVGLISLVAANVEEMSPLVRFAGIAAVWLAAVAVAERLATRAPAEVDGEPALAVGAARVVAVAAYGGTVFQAAQSLQVPAYTSSLLGCWALGAVVYAYACRGVAPLVVGVAAGVGWFAWAVGERSDSAGAVVVALLSGAVVATAVAGLHDDRVLPQFADPWRYVGAGLGLAALFAAALPDLGDDQGRTGAAVWAAVSAVGLAAAVGTRLGAPARREVAASVAILAAGLLLVVWTSDSHDDALTGPELVRAVVSTALYLAAAIWYGVLGAVRDHPRLTSLATAALVLFVVVQSFGVFAPLLSGAALFLVLGVVLVTVGLLADRGRRRLVEEVAE